jgi:hypothetical protein
VSSHRAGTRQPYRDDDTIVFRAYGEPWPPYSQEPASPDLPVTHGHRSQRRPWWRRPAVLVSIAVAVAAIAVFLAGIILPTPTPGIPTGDVRACQMVKSELNGAQDFEAAERAAVSPQLKQDIKGLAGAMSATPQGQPNPVIWQYTQAAMAQAANNAVSADCAPDGVYGISIGS